MYFHNTQEEREKYGVIDFEGNTILNCEYDEITALESVKNALLVTITLYTMPNQEKIQSLNRALEYYVKKR